MRDDPVRDFDLAAHGVDGDHRARELAARGELVEQDGDGRDLVGLFGHADLGQRQPRTGRVGRQHVQRLQPPARIAGAARGLAVDGDLCVQSGPERGDPAFEAAPEQRRID